MSKPKKEKNEISATKQILIEILESLGAMYEFGVNAHRPFRLPRDYKALSQQREEYVRLKKLEYRRLIKVKKKENELFGQLTEKGYLEGMKALILSKDAKLMDGEFCLVVFDVPEDMRRVRWAFRNLLKRAGFYKVQRSVWESDRDVVEELRVLVKQLKLEKYIIVYRANGPR